VLDLSSSISSGRKRAEQAVNTYYRLFKDELQTEIERDFARQSEPVSQIAHRNRYLAQKLKDAPEDVKALVERSRLKAGDGEQRRVVWADADSASEEEIQRRNEALKLNE
jgi:hypothetical protein